MPKGKQVLMNIPVFETTRRRARRHGFSLIELMVTIGVLLSSVVVATQLIRTCQLHERSLSDRWLATRELQAIAQDLQAMEDGSLPSSTFEWPLRAELAEHFAEARVRVTTEPLNRDILGEKLVLTFEGKDSLGRPMHRIQLTTWRWR
jgi:prepilin-type N-terminal cleavage/methylation domain-containing protein